jgi:hypothetical protein
VARAGTPSFNRLSLIFTAHHNFKKKFAHLIVECEKVVYLIYQLTTNTKHNEKRNRTTFSRIFSSLLPYWTITRHLLKMIYAICLMLIATGFVMAALTDYTIKHNDSKHKRIYRQILRK